MGNASGRKNLRRDGRAEVSLAEKRFLEACNAPEISPRLRAVWAILGGNQGIPTFRMAVEPSGNLVIACRGTSGLAARLIEVVEKFNRENQESGGEPAEIWTDGRVVPPTERAAGPEKKEG